MNKTENICNKPIFCIMGPTASGKSDLALKVAEHMPCEIVSVDSAQVYRGMDIGTAKPSALIQARIPHHLIDIRDPIDPYSAEDFRQDALRVIEEILSRNKMPLLVGGTMLYFKALQQGLSPLPSANLVFRAKITKEAETIGWIAMHDRLKAIDPVSANRIHPNDAQRTLRALEIYETTGQTMTALCEANQVEASPYIFKNFAIDVLDRRILHEKIAARFECMLAMGLIDEVKVLYARGDLHPDLPSIRAVGYRQIWDYLAGHIDFEAMKACGIAATRQLAKHQLTWLRTWPNVTWVDPMEFDVCHFMG